MAAQPGLAQCPQSRLCKPCSRGPQLSAHMRHGSQRGIQAKHTGRYTGRTQCQAELSASHKGCWAQAQVHRPSHQTAGPRQAALPPAPQARFPHQQGDPDCRLRQQAGLGRLGADLWHPPAQHAASRAPASPHGQEDSHDPRGCSALSMAQCQGTCIPHDPTPGSSKQQAWLACHCTCVVERCFRDAQASSHARHRLTAACTYQQPGVRCCWKLLLCNTP